MTVKTPAGHRHHDGRRHQQLGQRKAVFLSQASSCHCDFLVLTVMRRASSRSRRVDPLAVRGASIARPRDQDLQDHRVVRIRRQRLDRPAPNIDRLGGNRRPAADDAAELVDVVDVAGDVRPRLSDGDGDRPGPPVADWIGSATSDEVSVSGSPMMSKPHVRPRNCSIFCSASTAANVPVRADAVSAIEIANICPRTATAPASSPAAMIVSTSEKPDSDLPDADVLNADLLDADLAKPVHHSALLVTDACNSFFTLRTIRPSR